MKPKKEYDHRSHSKGMLQVHLIFVTRFRRACLTGAMAAECKELLEHTAHQHGWEILKMETDKDHVHILLGYPPTISISDIVRTLKQQSTYWMWQKFEDSLRRLYWHQNTFWSKGYFYCSIGSVSADIIEKYIENQG